MNNLKKLRKDKGLLQDDVARFLGLTRPAYSHYETGRRVPDAAMLEKLADLFEVTTDDILGRNDKPFGRGIEEVPELLPEEEVMLPLVASLRCGPDTQGVPFTFIKNIPCPVSYVRKWGEGLRLILAVGESMSPTIIPGDMLVCKPGDEWSDGNVVVVNAYDCDMVKRIFRTSDGGIDLRSDNPAYDVIHYTAADLASGDVHVLGRVMIPIPQEL